MVLQILEGGLETLAMLLIVVIFLLILLSSAIRIVKEYERAVIFRLGRLVGTKGPGLIILIPFIDRGKIVDLRLLTMDVPKQRIITKDNVTVEVDAAVYFRVADPIQAVVKVSDYITATSLISQTTLRDVLGQVDFDEILSRREELNKKLQMILDEITNPWGIKVTAVAIKDVTIPESMQRAIAKQAEAERERRGRIIQAEGELQASRKMAEAAEFYAKNPIALRLRELQTWTEIAREKNLIIVVPHGFEHLGTIMGLMKDKRGK